VYEVLEPGCISDQLLRESDVILNLNHNSAVLNVLGRCKNGQGTLKLTKNLRNINCECDLPKTNAGNDSLELIKRGDITGMSFAFDDDWEDSENGVSYERIEERNDKGKEVWLRHVKRITALYDVSIVTNPAYEQTTVATRELSDEIEKAIDEQQKRENPGTQETEEEKQAREAKEREANGGETNAEKAAREEREKQEREANGGETNAEKAAREEREKQEREAVAVMRMRQRQLDLDIEEENENPIY
jgi:HK97 family phage prohead protease